MADDVRVAVSRLGRERIGAITLVEECCFCR
jgi:hypothetical protein